MSAGTPAAPAPVQDPETLPPAMTPHAPEPGTGTDPGVGRGLRRATAVLVTGAGGEMGHGLLHALAERGSSVVAIDIRELDPQIRSLCRDTFVGDICDPGLLERLLAAYEIDE